MLDLPQHAVVVFELRPLVGRQRAGFFQAGDRLQRVARADLRQRAAVEQLQELDHELDVANAAVARLHVSQIAAFAFHALLDAALLPLVPVVSLPAGTTVNSPGVRNELRAIEETSTRIVERSRVAGYASTGDKAFVSDDGRTAFVYVFPPRSDDAFGVNVDAQRDLRDALKSVTVAGAAVRLTGYDALFDSSGEADDGPGVLLEAVLGGVGALVVLVFVFGSWLALVPLAMAICSILVSFLLLYGLTAITDVSPIVQFLVALIGLGISIDYALIIVVRWREERENGLEGDEAVVAAMRTAGRAVVFSGTTVAVGLLALLALPLPFLRSMGYGGMLIPFVATLVALTLLPTILATVGPRLDRRSMRKRDRSHHFWQSWSEMVVRRRGLAASSRSGSSSHSSFPRPTSTWATPTPTRSPRRAPPSKGSRRSTGPASGRARLHPVETLVPEADAAKVAAAEASVPNVHGASAPESDDWRREGLAVVAAVPNAGDETEAGRDAVQEVIDAAHKASPQAQVGGSGPLNADFIDAVYGSFPLMIALISLLTFLLLARAFRSLLLPLKAVILNVFSVGAAWGVMALIWQKATGPTRSGGSRRPDPSPRGYR